MNHYNALVPVKPLVPVYAAASMSKERGLLDIIVSSPLTRSAVGLHKEISQDDLTFPTSKIHNVIPVHISQCMDERKQR